MIVKRFSLISAAFLLFPVIPVLAAPQDLPVKSISVPAWNVITDTLFVMTPAVNGKRNDFLMRMVCGLARGDITQQQVNATLAEKKVNINGIPESGSPLSLLVNGNVTQQATTCAAYLASSLFMPADNQQYFDEKKVPSQPRVDEGNGFWQRLTGKKTTTKNTPEKQEYVLNTVRFEQGAKEKIALAQATAQFYAIIAKNIQSAVPLSYAAYQKRTADVVRNYAGEYLRSIGQFYLSQDKAHFTAMTVDMGSFRVENSTGNAFQMQGSDFLLTARGVPWFGNGKILGKDYFVDVAIIATPAVAEGKVQTKQKKGGLNK
ncbi:TPA: hypothetical protein ACY4O8_001357 [Enterobacter cloacae]|uniref:hypothetical protein n=1 Tax=Enterobacter cloacae complex sp. CARB60 TaxID=3119569 RepID=UPI002F400E68